MDGFGKSCAIVVTSCRDWGRGTNCFNSGAVISLTTFFNPDGCSAVHAATPTNSLLSGIRRPSRTTSRIVADGTTLTACDCTTYSLPSQSAENGSKCRPPSATTMTESAFWYSGTTPRRDWKSPSPRSLVFLFSPMDFLYCAALVSRSFFPGRE